MKIIVLSSGSKGNTTYVETEKTKVLIDAGNSYKYICEKLDSINVSPSDINAILITHTHSDHIKGLQLFIKKYHTKVYITEEMIKDIPFITNYVIINEENIVLNDINIDIINTSHDVSSIGFILSNNNKSLVYLTDTGYINKRYFNILKNRDVYIMESNHDIEMLINGPYHFKLKQRILSDKGHLSNEASARYLSEFIGNKTKYILLAHLSEENNTKEIAYNTLINRLEHSNIKIDNIIITKQNEISDGVEV